MARCPGGIRDAPEALVAAQHLHDLEDAGRGQRPGQRSAQRLRHGAELDAPGVGEIAQMLFENPGAPVGIGDIREIAAKRAEQLARVCGQHLCDGAVRRDRPRCNVKPGLVGELDDRLGARLETRDRLQKARTLARAKRPFESLLAAMPIKVVLNTEVALLGAAVFASQFSAATPA